MKHTNTLHIGHYESYSLALKALAFMLIAVSLVSALIILQNNHKLHIEAQQPSVIDQMAPSHGADDLASSKYVEYPN